MSFARYPAYKDSGVDWLGEVPVHWAVSKIGFESWVRARLGWKGLKADEYVQDGFAFLSTPNIKGGEIDFENVNYIDQARYDESPEIKIQVGDVLLAKDGSTLGTVNIVRRLPRPTTVNGSIAVITPGKCLAGDFLYYLFRGAYLENLIQRVKGGMGVPHLFQSDLNQFAIPLPSIEEQIQIAAFLDHETAKIDALVAEQERLMALLKEKRQAVISHAITRGLNPNAPMKDSGIAWLGEVPAHWEVSRLKYATTSIVDCPHETPEYCEDGPYMVIRTADLDQGTLDDSLMYRVSESEYQHRIRRQPLNADDIVYGREGERWGHAGLVPASGRYCLGQRMMQFRVDIERFAPAYLMWHLNARVVYVQGSLDTVGSTAPHVNVATIRNYWIAEPPMEEQRSIGEYVTAITAEFDSLTHEAQQAIHLLQERRAALISAAVSGQIDVRTLSPEPAS